jgi:cullin 1
MKSMEQNIEEITDICIQQIFKIIYMKENIHLTMEDINKYYTQIYTFLVSDEEDKNGKFLYELYCSSLEKFYKKEIIPKIDNSVDFIDFISNFYNANESCIKYLSLLIFRYLERYYIKNNGLKTIQEKSKDIFEKVIYKNYEGKIINITIQNLNNYRMNEDNSYDLKTLFYLISQFNKLEESNIIYQNIQLSTKMFFSNYNLELISEHNFDTYYSELQKSYSIEEKLFQNVFDENLYKSHINFIDKIVINDKIENFDQRNYIIQCIQNRKYTQLKVLYQLLKKIKKEESIIVPYIIESSTIELNDIENTSENIEIYINNFMENNKEYEMIFDKSFENNNKFINGYKKHISLVTSKDIIIKNKKYSFIKLLVSHLNYYLNKKPENLDNEFLDKYFSIALNLSEKDYYIELYSKFLAKRLLFTKYDIEKETEILSVFKRHFGFSSTIKIENMIKDIILNKETLGNKYKVLTLTHWPTYKNTNCALPREVLDILDNYTKDYTDKFNQRKIEWNNDISTVVFVLELDKKYHITCTFIEFSIIKLFLKKMDNTFQDIINNLSIDKDKLLTYLNNLVKNKLLLSNEDKIDESTILTFNKHFKSKKIRFSLPIPSVDKSQEEGKNKIQVCENRNEIIKAAIVRIMKSKKTLDHNSIIIELSNNISLFQPQVKNIKICIENLIDREYLERSTDNPSVYNYLA